MCAHTITVYTTGKQLSVLHVYQGFPPIKQHTYPLSGHTQPLCTLLKNNFQGLMFSRAAPPFSSSQHKQPLCGHTETLCGLILSEDQSTSSSMFQSLCTLMENNFQGPIFIRGSPYKTAHIPTVWAHIIIMYPTGKQLSSSSCSSQYKQPLCEQTKPLCEPIPL